MGREQRQDESLRASMTRFAYKINVDENRKRIHLHVCICEN